MSIGSTKADAVPESVIARANTILHEQRERAETRRVLYVALTRGKDHVYVSLRRQFNKPNKDTGEVALRKASGIARLLQGHLLEDQIMPLRLAPSTVPTYAPRLGPFQYIDRSEPSQWTPQPEMISVTQLLPPLEGGLQSNAQSVDARAVGTLVHDVLEVALRHHATVTERDLEALLRAHPEALDHLIPDALQHLKQLHASPIWATLTGVETEKTLGAMLDITLVYGRLDAVRITGKHAEVWDWKTNDVSAETVETAAEHYRLQLEAYAWILLSSQKVDTVAARLVFTAIVQSDLTASVVEQKYSRADLDALSERLRTAAFG